MKPSIRPSPTKRPLLASFAIYALPLFNVHGPAWLYGASLLRGLLQRDGESHSFEWLACDLVLALLAQLTAFLLLRRAFPMPALQRLLVLVPGALVLCFIVNFGHQVLIPAHFLVPADKAREQLSWIPQCSVEDARVVQARMPADLALAVAGQVVIARGEMQDLWLLEAPSCTLTDLGVQSAEVSGVPWVAPDGALLFQALRSPEEEAQLIYQPGPKAQRVEVEPPPGASDADGAPALSNDGAWAAWIGRKEGSDKPSLLLHPFNSADERDVELRSVGVGGLEILAVDLDANEILLARNQSEFLVVGWDGYLHWGPIRPRETVPLARTFLRYSADGWVAWDGYRDHGNYRVEWSMPEGTGVHQVLAGRSILSVAVDTSGEYIAISVASSYSIGNAKDSVYVLRTVNGSEVFRKYLPPHSGSQVAFIGPGLLAYTEAGSVVVVGSPDD